MIQDKKIKEKFKDEFGATVEDFMQSTAEDEQNAAKNEKSENFVKTEIKNEFKEEQKNVDSE